MFTPLSFPQKRFANIIQTRYITLYYKCIVSIHSHYVAIVFRLYHTYF
nr:MAG TPA: hypothetical protein [Caudoviricetes sp.]